MDVRAFRHLVQARAAQLRKGRSGRSHALLSLAASRNFAPSEIRCFDRRHLWPSNCRSVASLPYQRPPCSCSAPARAIAKAPRTADLLKSRQQYPAEPGRGRYKRLPQKGEHDARRSASERRLRAQSRSFFHVPTRLITARRLPHARSATYGPTASSCKRRLTPLLGEDRFKDQAHFHS